MKNNGSTSPEYVYDYHWGRILFAIAVGLAVTGGVIYWLLSPQQAPTAALAAEESSPKDPEPTLADASAKTIEQASLQSENMPAEKLAPELSQPAEIAAETETAEAAAIEQTAATEQAAESVTQEAETEEQIAASPVSVNPVSKLAPEPVAEPVTATEPPAKTRAELFTAAIKRAKLTTRVSRLEPGSELPSEFKGNPDELEKVYFYTEVLGQAGKTHYHHWYHNGKLAAKVPIAIGSDRWRCYSSKYLTDKQSGDWQVKVTDSKGKLLAKSEFHYSDQE